MDWRKEFDTSAPHYTRAREKAYIVQEKTGWISTTEVDYLIAEEVMKSWNVKKAEYDFWKEVMGRCEYHIRDLNTIINS